MTITSPQRSVLLAALALAAWLPARSPAQPNLAAAREGAQVVAASSAQGRQFAAANLIDGDPATSWATAEGKTEKQWAIIRLAGERSVEIGSLALDNTATRGHPAEAGVRNFELAASTRGRADEDFRRIDIFSCRMGAGRQVFTFPPARARFVKLIPRSNFGFASFIEVNELAVFPAGAPPVAQPGGATVLLHATEASAGALAPLARSLAAAGTATASFPGDRASRRLSSGDLLGVRAAITAGEVRLTREEVELLDRFCRRGGGVVCAVPSDPAPVEPLLSSLGATVTPPGAGDGELELLPHWITDALPPPAAAGPLPSFTLGEGAPLVRRGELAVAVAAAVEKGRLVVLPLAFLTPTAPPEGASAPADGLELARRAVLWAAGMDEVAPPPTAPLRLEGTAVFVRGGDPARPASFERLKSALVSRGLRVTEARGSGEALTRADLGDASVLIAFMPRFTPGAAADLAGWVTSGGAALVLGDADATPAEIVQTNAFLRDFGAAIAAAPAKNLTVAVGAHPATAGIDALSRPGDILGAWCLQGTALATMAGTPVALARTAGRGRVIVMDAGFAVDPVTPPPEQRKPPPAFGIQLQQNEQFLVQCVGWLVGEF